MSPPRELLWSGLGMKKVCGGKDGEGSTVVGTTAGREPPQPIADLHRQPLMLLLALSARFWDTPSR